MSMSDQEKLDIQLDAMQEMLFHAEDIAASLKGTGEDTVAYETGLSFVKELAQRYNQISKARREALALKNPYL